MHRSLFYEQKGIFNYDFNTYDTVFGSLHIDLVNAHLEKRHG